MEKPSMPIGLKIQGFIKAEPIEIRFVKCISSHGFYKNPWEKRKK